MLSLVTAAEDQYRYDASIREHRRAAEAPVPVASPSAPAAPRTRRAAWARPIGANTVGTCSTACATA